MMKSKKENVGAAKSRGGLREYNKKRDFKQTAEPKGEKAKTKANRFVVQHHKARADHYDFRLEYDGVLLSWAVPKGLSQNPKHKRLAIQVEDHPVDYINFEGVIPKGNYGAGTVEIFDSGNYLPLYDLNAGLKKGHVKIALNGEKLKGGWSLVRTDGDNWIAVKTDDEFAIFEEKKKSEKLPFKSCNAQLATLCDKIPKGKDWIFEIKYDGYRMLAFVEKGKAKLYTRNHVDWTQRFKQISNAIEKIEQESFVVDGEIVVFDENGKSDFSMLQSGLKKGGANFYYVIFDLLAVGEEDLRPQPLKKRKEKLERLLHKAQSPLMFSSHVADGKACFEFAKEKGLEGIVAKNLQSAYRGERSEDWLKIKCRQRQEFVIGGFVTSEKNEVLSALLVGCFKNGKLVYFGKVGTGFSDEKRQDLSKKFAKIVANESPFEPSTKVKNVTWLKPKLVAEIEFAELTKDGVLRQPSFVGLRDDKDAKDVKWEKKSE